MKSITQILKDNSPLHLMSNIDPALTGPSDKDTGNPDCKICKGTGFVHPRKTDGNVDYGRVVNCECIREDMKKQGEIYMLRSCELPETDECNNMRFENYTVYPGHEDAYKYSIDLASGTGLKWLTLMGNTDRGKTHLAISICRRWMERGVPARYAYVPLLLDDIRAGFGAGNNNYESRFEYYTKVPLLVLDDLGAENSTPWVQEKLDTIVDRRLMLGLALVVTTNKPMDQLPFRIASRLQRHPKGKVVYVGGMEYRVQKKLTEAKR